MSFKLWLSFKDRITGQVFSSTKTNAVKMKDALRKGEECKQITSHTNITKSERDKFKYQLHSFSPLNWGPYTGPCFFWAQVLLSEYQPH